jgi:hypothetical protein
MSTTDSPNKLQNLILDLRNHRVMIDADLARIYGVSTKRLNEQVKRNKNRFPRGFHVPTHARGKG